MTTEGGKLSKQSKWNLMLVYAGVIAVWSKENQDGRHSLEMSQHSWAS